jgi:hypothetical protein
VRDGLFVEADGARQSDGAILAREVEREDDPDDAAPPPAGPQLPQPIEVEREGPVTGLGGACPVRSFSVSGQPVVTDASTRFEHVTCETLQNGLPVKVRGTTQSSGVLLPALPPPARRDSTMWRAGIFRTASTSKCEACFRWTGRSWRRA